MKGLMRKVSCIIPTKNRPDLISRAVESVLAQTHTEIEIIIVDDSTNNETQRVVSSFGGSIRYIKNEKSRGAPYSRNVGLSEAKGDVIAFLDDDDRWFPKKIEKQLETLIGYPIVTCNYIMDVRGKTRYFSYPRVILYEDLLCFNALGSCSFVVVDAVAAKDCFFDENMKAGQDWDYWLTVMKKNNSNKAGNAGEYLVEYNGGHFSRITTTVDVLPVVEELYSKRTIEYTPELRRWMLFYNNQEKRSWFEYEWGKAKRKNCAGIIFMAGQTIKKLRGRVEHF